MSKERKFVHVKNASGKIHKVRSDHKVLRDPKAKVVQPKPQKDPDPKE